ncbi:hypothetical protein QF008_001926 [Pseudomonas protegens]|nr:hypothetical protein [Pseudomonas protegens]ROM24811.1 hypothetical protein BK644_22445 [Pseudomonas protegens]
MSPGSLRSPQSQNVQLAIWLHTLCENWKLPVTGRYLPIELDDLHFQAADRRAPSNPGAMFSLRYRPWGKPLLDHQLTPKARDVQNP